ncbi:hypothetical protein, partial [Geobacillus stearothermophilus]|uniref:hypothetical protein n=1 Tax=Geobacillus stearothermophilus TaxID=1422 RepID=UPI001C7D5C0B
LFAVFSLGSFLSIGNPGWPLLCLSMPKFMEGVCLILDNQHSCYLTLYEFMFLIIRDEYGGFCCDEYGNSDGVHLSVKSPAFYRGDAKLPTPTINYNKKYGRRSIKAGMVDIDVYMPDGSWVIKPQYADKFGALLKNTEKYRKISGGKLPPAPTLVALALKEKLNLNVAKKEEE